MYAHVCIYTQMCYSGNSKIKRQIRCLPLDSEIVMVQDTKHSIPLCGTLQKKSHASSLLPWKLPMDTSTDLSYVFKVSGGSLEGQDTAMPHMGWGCS